MAFIKFAGTAMVEIIHTLNGQICENVFYVARGANYTAPDLSNLAAAIKTWWDTSLQPYVVDDCSLGEVRATAMHAEDAPRVSYTTGLPLAGSVVGDAAPGNVTITTTFQTDKRGRRYRGRAYHIGLWKTALVGNELDGAARAGIEGAWLALNAVLIARTENHVVASRAPAVVVGGFGITTNITSYRTNRYLDSQRRRLQERGS